MKMRTHKRARVRAMAWRRWHAIKLPIFGRTRMLVGVDLASGPDLCVISDLRDVTREHVMDMRKGLAAALMARLEATC